MTADQNFLKGIICSINAKAPLRGSQLLCDCCRGMSLMVQQARHRQLPVPRVIHKVYLDRITETRRMPARRCSLSAVCTHRGLSLTTEQAEQYSIRAC